MSIFEPILFDPSRYAERVEHIRRNVGPLLAEVRAIRDYTMLIPAAYVLPESWNPGQDPSDDSPRPVDEVPAPATLFGLPVMWDPDERMGLFYEVTP